VFKFRFKGLGKCAESIDIQTYAEKQAAMNEIKKDGSNCFHPMDFEGL